MDESLSCNNRNEARERISIKNKCQEMILFCMRLSYKDPRVDIRICNHHEEENVDILVKWYTRQGKVRQSLTEMYQDALVFR
jgi:hypothetical protein